MVEAKLVAGKTKYFLGYKFVARKCEEHPHPGKWHGQFKFKNEAAPPPHAEGIYLDNPVEITNAKLHAWLSDQRFGMAELSPDLIPAIEAVFTAPGAHAKRCA